MTMTEIPTTRTNAQVLTDGPYFLTTDPANGDAEAHVGTCTRYVEQVQQGWTLEVVPEILAADGWLCACIELAAHNVGHTAGVNIDAPDHTDHPGHRRDPGPSDGAKTGWAKLPDGTFGLRVVLGHAVEGDQVEVTTRAGKTSTETLGPKVKTSKGWNYHTLVTARPTEPGRARWTKMGDEWAVLAPGGETGQTVTVHKANGDTAEVTLGEEIGRDDVKGGIFRPARTAPKAADQAPTIELEHGRVYATADGRFVKVAESKTGNVYGKLWVGPAWNDWEYSGKAILREITRTLTADEAAAWGHDHARCVFCSTKLAKEGDGKSVDVGYGPICAEKYGLPWG